MSEIHSDAEVSRQIKDLSKENSLLSKLYHTIVNNSLDAILLTVPDGKILFANRAACDLFQMTEPEIIAGGRAAVVDMQDDRLSAALEERERTGQFRGELNLKKKDGTIFPAEVSSAVFKNEDGQLLTSMIIRDITERKQAQNRLLASEMRSRSLYDHAPLPYQSLDENGRFIDVNQSWLDTLDYERTDVIGRAFTEFLDPSWKDQFKERFPRFKAVGEILGAEFEMIKKDGTRIMVSFDGKIETDLQGDWKKTHCIFKNISDQHAIEEKLRESEANYRLLVDNQTDLVVKVDTDGKFEFVSPSYCTLFGKTQEELLCSRFMPLVHEEDRAPTVKAMEDLYHPPHKAYMEQRAKTNKGWRWIAWQDTAVLDENNDVVSIIGVGRDITDHKKLEEELYESEQKFRLLANFTFDWEYWLDPNGNYIYISPSCKRISGYGPDKFISDPSLIFRIVRPDYLDRVKAHYEDENYIDAPVFDMEFPIITADGEQRWLEHHCSPVFDKRDNYLGRRGNNRDVTDRKQAELALIESERKWRNVLVDTPQIGISLDPQARIVFANTHFLDLTGWRKQEIIGRDWFDHFISEPVREEVRNVFRTTMSQKDTAGFSNYENEIVLKSGEVRTISWNNVLTKDEIGNIVDVTCLGIDLTERIKAEENLRKSEENYRRIFDTSLVGIFQSTPQGHFIRVNHAFAQMLGYDSPDELLARIDDITTQYYVNPEDRQQYQQILKKNAQVEGLEYRVRCKDGTPIWVSNSTRTHFTKDGRVDRYEGLIVDITNRKASEAERDRLILAIEQVAEMIVITDADGDVQYVNPAFEQITGYSAKEVIGENPRLLKSGMHDDAFYKTMWDTLERGKIWSGRIVNQKKDGTFFTEIATISPVLNASGKTVNYVAVKRDITAEIAMEEKLRQAQKMEAIGTLAGGIAHDFNNILSAVIGYSELAMEKAEPGSQLDDNLHEIFAAGKRARDLVRQILTFARQADEDIRPLAVSLIAKETMKFLRASTPATIDLKTRIHSDALVMADPTQVHQILMNLCTNAAHAMEAQGGVLEVGVTDVTVEKGQIGVLTGPGQYVKLWVSDTGHGISQEVIPSIFDPYYTTKPPGEGTGMGLAVVHGIIHKYKGTITVDSHPRKGTVFTIYLPVIEKQGDSRVPDEGSLPGGTERILFVDDEPAIAKAISRIIGGLGYQVTIRTSPIEALALFHTRPDDFDLVITDMTMPKISGDQFASKLIAIRPELPIILCTGYSKKISNQSLSDAGVKAFVYKPILKSDLAQTVRRVLDEHIDRSL